MTGEPSRPRRRLFDHEHRRRPLRWWLLALALIVVAMIVLPRLVALLEP